MQIVTVPVTLKHYVFGFLHVFTSRPNSLLASNTASVLLYGIYIFAQYINIVSMNQKLMCSIQLQSFLIFLDLP